MLVLPLWEIEAAKQNCTATSANENRPTSEGMANCPKPSPGSASPTACQSIVAPLNSSHFHVRGRLKPPKISDSKKYFFPTIRSFSLIIPQ